MPSKNYGLVIDKPVIGQDYILGGDGSLGGDVLQPDGQWLKYLPADEQQSQNGFDPQYCASEGTENALAILANRLYGQNRNWSARFIAKVSDTTKQGNSPHKTAEALRKLGAPNELDWPYGPDISTWEAFYCDIPQSVYALATSFTAEFDFKHEYVVTTPYYLKKALQLSPVGISVCAWFKDSITDLYYKPEGMQDNHWVVLVGYEEGKYWLIYDSYGEHGEYVKKLHWDFGFTVAKRYTLNRQIVSEKSWAQYLIDLVLAALGLNKSKPEPIAPPLPQETVPPTVPPAPEPVKESKLETFCLAIRDYEGKPGDLNYRNNNPGNCRYSSQGYLKIYQPVLRDTRGFAIFKNYETGWLYLQNLVRAKIQANPKQSIAAFFEVYAPASDNNDPKRYAQVVAAAVGLKTTDPISKLV